jgi:hypothetical protein
MGQAEFERGSRLAGSSPLPEQGLILMAATTEQQVRDEWWDSLIHKLRTRPLGTQELMAVTGLLTQRYRGIELDDRRLSEALAVVFERKDMPPHLYAQYGDYALTYLHDGVLAERLFVDAVNRGPEDAPYAAKLFATLTADGHARQANAVFRRAVALGLMEDHGRTHADAGAPSVTD